MQRLKFRFHAFVAVMVEFCECGVNWA